MGRQSARIYFHGKDHKEIYFGGRYHDQMYLADSEGRAVLVWEKLREAVTAEQVSMLSCVNGKYYVVVEQPVEQGIYGMMHYSRPVLYEGSALGSMKRVGYIWKGRQVRGSSYIMHASPDRLVIIRSKDLEERYIAVIPLENGSAVLENVTHETGNKDYYHSNYERYVYGNGDSYYKTASTLWDAVINKNGTTISYSERIGGIDKIVPCNGKIVGVPRRIYANGVDTYLPFFVLDDDNGRLLLHKVSLTAHIENMVKELKDSVRNSQDTENVIVRNITVITDSLPYENNAYIEYVMTGREDGYLILFMTVEMQYETVVNKGTIMSGSKGLRMKFDFGSLQVKECQNITTSQYIYSKYNVISQIMDGEYRVQIVRRDVMSTTVCLTYGYTGQDYRKDIQVVSSLSSTLGTGVLTCIAHCGDKLIVGLMTDAVKKRFIEINTTDATAEYKEINIE